MEVAFIVLAFELLAPGALPPATHMAPDDLDRDKIYTAGADDGDSDAELELEPPDPQVLAAERQRAAAAINAHRKVINIDEVYRDIDANRDSEIVAEWVDRFRNYRFQFQIRHLLILTAVVAMLLAIRQWINLGTVFIVGIMLAVAGVSLYLKLEENKRQEATNRRRQKMYAERRAQQGVQTGQRVDDDDFEDEPAPSRLREETPPPAAPGRNFRLQFSLSQMFVVITVAAVVLGLGGAMGGMAGLATICGLVALAGLIVLVLGFNLPEVVVFGWWMMLALYVLLSLLSAIWASFAGG
jgi:hypothetical protein